MTDVRYGVFLESLADADYSVVNATKIFRYACPSLSLKEAKEAIDRASKQSAVIFEWDNESAAQRTAYYLRLSGLPAETVKIETVQTVKTEIVEKEEIFNIEIMLTRDDLRYLRRRADRSLGTEYTITDYLYDYIDSTMKTEKAIYGPLS